MTTAEKKAKFIQMKAEGQSYSKIAKALNISKSTCSRWGSELKEQTDKQETETLNSLYKQYGATRAARVKAIGETIKKIDTAVKNKDFSELSLDRLLSLKLKYTELLKNDYEPTPKRAALPDTLTADSVLNVLKDLLERSRNGEITDQQAERETKILTAVIKALQGQEQPETDENKTVNIIIQPATMKDYEKEVSTERKGITILEDLEPDETTEGSYKN